MPINFIQRSPFFDSLSGRTDEWTTGTGSIGPFTLNGLTAENYRVWDTDPWGNPAVVWETRPTGTNDADGGWNTSYYPIDNTKLYRFSVWARTTSTNTDTTYGRFYLGCNGSPTTVDDMDNCATNGNPYWFSSYYLSTYFTINKWYLFVGHLWPHDAECTAAMDTHPNSGRWSIAGGLEASINSGHDYKFNKATTSVRHRAYHYYSSQTTARLQFYDPRLDLCDGSEGTIESLLLGPPNYSGNTLAQESVTRWGQSFKNQHVDATGGDEIFEVGHWRIHKFTSSGSFQVKSFVGSALEVDYLIVAGGGGAGSGYSDPGGAGGAGGVLSGYCYLTGTTYTVTVGGGGASGTSDDPGSNGTNSSFNGATAIGGGGGGAANNYNGLAGGSGGGGSFTGIGGTGTAGQGYAGGDGEIDGNASGGGGGYASIGQDGVAVTIVDGGRPMRGRVEGQPINYGGGGYGWDYATVPITPTGSNGTSVSQGYYGYGANGTPVVSPYDSPYDGNGGIVIIRYKFR